MSEKAILINPPSGMYIRDNRCPVPVNKLSSALRMPLDLAYMAAILENEGFECIIKDYPAEHANWQALKIDLTSFNPSFLVMSTTAPTLSKDLIACRIAKEINRDILTIAKGAYFIADDLDIIRECPDLDVAIRGEYEIAIKEIAQARPLKDILGITYREDGASVRNDNRPFMDNIDILPFPARHLLNNSFYKRPDTDEPLTTIQTNRGCPANCVFCLVRQDAGRSIISRSTESIIEEMILCKEKFGINNIYFYADTFTWNKEWVIKLCKQIISTNVKFHWVTNSRVDTLDEERIYWMKKAGCWMIGFGIESGDQGMLDKMKKGITLQQVECAMELCSKFKIKTYLFWLLGLPWENKQTIYNTIRFAKRLKGDFAEFHIAFPFPGTEFYYTALEHGLFDKKDLLEGNIRDGIVRTFFLTRERLRYYQNLATRQFYSDPRRIFRLLKAISSPKVFINYCRKAWSVLKR